MEQRAAPSFSARLIAWQREAGRHSLPWQNTREPYRIWLSEVMLQQTQVAAALPYYQRFLERFPDLRALARAPNDDVMAAWAGLGYYSRARCLHRCAQILVEQFGGIFPNEPDELQALPGIGRSTAAAIAVFAFGRRAAILDGNVKRVLCRIFGIDRPMEKAATERELVAFAETLLPSCEIERYTQGLMDLGATLCTPRRPQCSRCPFQSDCVALLSGRIEALPRAKPRRVVPTRFADFMLFRHAGRIYLERRADEGIWGGLWSLPQSAFVDQASGLLAGRAWATACAAAFQGTEGLAPGVEPIGRFTHGFTHFTLEAVVWLVTLERLPDTSFAASSVGRWVNKTERAALALPKPIASVLEMAETRTQMALI